MNNPLETIKLFVGKGGNPQQVIEKLMKNNSNPVINNLIQLSKNGDVKTIESFAKNMFKEKGRDFDKEFSEFMSYFK